MTKQLSFSQRMGLTPVRKAMQLEKIDGALHNHLWNLIYDHYLIPGTKLRDPWDSQNSWVIERYKLLHTEFFADIWAEAPWTPHAYYEYMKRWYQAAAWHRIYSLLEFMAKLMPPEFCTELNARLRDEHAGYRLIESSIVPITSDEEIDAVERAAVSPVDSVRGHVSEALRLLADRETQNYRNVVKEAISAVEAACQVATGKEKASLRDGLAILRARGTLHPALEGAFKQLYGWSSDADGIRHALTDNAITVDVDTARFMLVASSAFANYLLANK